MGKKRQGHYCIVCGRRRPNEKFSGKGHARHICRDCQKLTAEKKEEILLINKIWNTAAHMNRKNRSWLEEMKNDPRERVSKAAEAALEFWSGPHIEQYEEEPGFEPDEMLVYEEEYDADQDLQYESLMETIYDLPF
ncbi:MAG: hypothetical protein IKD68_01050 [Solobacterium sp.]|nr:hypothetical protein [Solobacterium sp.]